MKKNKKEIFKLKEINDNIIELRNSKSSFLCIIQNEEVKRTFEQLVDEIYILTEECFESLRIDKKKQLYNSINAILKDFKVSFEDSVILPKSVNELDIDELRKANRYLNNEQTIELKDLINDLKTSYKPIKEWNENKKSIDQIIKAEKEGAVKKAKEKFRESFNLKRKPTIIYVCVITVFLITSIALGLLTGFYWQPRKEIKMFKENQVAWENVLQYDSTGTIIVGASSCVENATELIIPATHKGKAVVGIAANAFANEKYANITSVMIPSTIKSIGEDAFAGCNISSDTNGIKVIGTSQSSFANYLNEDIYESANWIVGNENETLPNLTYSEIVGIADGALKASEERTTENTITIQLGGLKYVGKDAFAGRTEIKAIQTSETKGDLSTIEIIGSSAFANCNNLGGIAIHNEKVAIAEDAFSGCGNLVNVTYKNGDDVVLVGTYDKANGVTCPQITPTKVGYSFSVWSIDGANEYQFGYEVQTDEITLQALLVPNTYRIYIDSNGGYEVAPIEVTYDSSYEIDVVPTRTGYTFNKYTLNGEDYVISEKYQEPKDITLKAEWTPIERSIIYDANGGIADKNTETVEYDSAYTLTNATRTGYKFIGWYKGETKWESGKWTHLENLTLVAKWEPETYKINYNLNGGTNDSNNPSEYTIESSSITLNDLTKTGYEFIGWTYSGQSTPVKNATIPQGTTGDRTFTANWVANTYMVTYNANGGEVGLDTQEITFGEDYQLAIPTRAGYIFEGWYKGEEKINSIGTWQKPENLTLKAMWCEFPPYLKVENNTIVGLSLEKVKKENFKRTIIIPNTIKQINFSAPSFFGDIIFDENKFEDLAIDEVVIGEDLEEISLPEIENLENYFLIHIIGSIFSRTEIIVDSANLYFSSKQGNLYNKAGSTLYHTYAESVDCLKNVETIGPLAFSCKAIQVLEIPNTVKRINSLAFWCCNEIYSVTIPNSVLNIDNYAFHGCHKITEIQNFSTLNITLKSETYGGIAEYAKSIIKAGEKPKISKDANGLVVYNGNTLIAYDINKGVDIAVPNGIKVINSYAFSNCKNVTSIILPQGVETIGANALENCENLEKLVIPNTVKEYADMFWSFPKLKEIECPMYILDELFVFGSNSLESITIVDSSNNEGFFNVTGENAWRNNDIKIEIRTTKYEGHIAFTDILENITVRFDGVEEISDCAFSVDEVWGEITIIIPKTVTKLGSWLIQGEINNVNIKYEGTFNEWIALTANSNWNVQMDDELNEINYNITYLA